MAAVADDIEAAGAQIIWVLERTAANAPGTAANCLSFMSNFTDSDGSALDTGWCVGDSQTVPVAYTFDNSPFSIGRGFDMIVPTSTMTIEFSSSHGSPGGNQNLNGTQLLAEVEAVVASLP